MRYDEYKETEYYNKSRHLFLDFLNEKLNGDVEKLKGYCFDELKW